MTIRTILLWLPAVMWMTVIFVLSSFSSLPTPPGFIGVDKLEHYTAYGIMSILVFVAMRGTRPDWSILKVAVAVVVISAVYGITDEIHQSFVPDRQAEVLDWISDVLGAITGAGLASIVTCMRKGKTTDYGGKLHGE
ncbi:MAG TPA: VanZ family protein [Armatimonadota bacterium]|jgi:VanZ family protein|nr:VanZ family protein [Armatimonadota bacterium]HOM71396.1 VanZ family protein [Armatimonadota bacterium]HPP75927.1 VanZ family protein [Armatimonadota bacterium]